MGKLTDLLMSNKLSLIVSLPNNDIEMAKAAIAGGADAIKVHINVNHRASGNIFGSLEENRTFFETLANEFSGPLGIVPGGSLENIHESELKELETMGFNYFSVYMKHMPSFMLDLNMEKTVAGDAEYSLNTVSSLNGTRINAFEASIIPGEEYGTPLNFQDLLKYKSIVDVLDIPVIVPSQRKIVPRDVPHLADIGIKAVMIGAVVTGKDPITIERTTKEIRKAMDQ